MLKESNRNKRSHNDDEFIENINFLHRIKVLEEECESMIRFISNMRDEQKKRTLKEELVDRYSKLSVDIDKLEDSYGSKDEDDKLIVKTYGEIIKVHQELSCLTLPATPVSLMYTEFANGGYLEKNKTVNLLILLTIGFFIAFLVLNIIVHDIQNAKTTIISAPEWLNMLLIFSSSGLGAGFFTLITVKKYLVNRTFSPRYNTTYLIRFITGVTAGTILAMICPEMKIANGQEIGTGIIAIVGGFSADVVVIILKRIAEILKTALTGESEKEIKIEKAVQSN